MSFPDILPGTYVSIRVEHPAGSGTQVDLCGLTTRNLTEQVNTRDRFTRDCATPGSIPFRFLVAQGKQWDLSGSGLYNRAQAALVSTLVGAIRTYQFYVGEPADDEVYGSYFTGDAMLTQRQITSGDEEDVGAEMVWASNGEWVETVIE